MTSRPALLLLQDGWRAEHALPSEWVANLGSAAAFLIAACFLFLVLRGLAQTRRFRATGVLGEAERRELAEAIARAEGQTSGEIAVVVLERSDRHPGADWLAAALSMFFGSVLFTGWLPWDSPAAFFLSQLALGAIGFLAARLIPGFKRAFVSEARADEMAREQALQEFYAMGLHRTSAKSGVLLFVSLFERRALVLGDEGIDAKLDPSHWREVDAAILAGMRDGSLKRGLAEGIRLSAQVLCEHFPRDEDDRDEVPDHVVVRRD